LRLEWLASSSQKALEELGVLENVWTSALQRTVCRFAPTFPRKRILKVPPTDLPGASPIFFRSAAESAIDVFADRYAVILRRLEAADGLLLAGLKHSEVLTRQLTRNQIAFPVRDHIQNDDAGRYFESLGRRSLSRMGLRCVCSRR
jgi:hypothetical protein